MTVRYDEQMVDPLTKLRRRPFLAPLMFPLLALLAAGAGNLLAWHLGTHYCRGAGAPCRGGG
jgi:hypothetical protein